MPVGGGLGIAVAGQVKGAVDQGGTGYQHDVRLTAGNTITGPVQECLLQDADLGQHTASMAGPNTLCNQCRRVAVGPYSPGHFDAIGARQQFLATRINRRPLQGLDHQFNWLSAGARLFTTLHDTGHANQYRCLCCELHCHRL